MELLLGLFGNFKEIAILGLGLMLAFLGVKNKSLKKDVKIANSERDTEIVKSEAVKIAAKQSIKNVRAELEKEKVNNNIINRVDDETEILNDKIRRAQVGETMEVTY